MAAASGRLSGRSEFVRLMEIGGGGSPGRRLGGQRSVLWQSARWTMNFARDGGEHEGLRDGEGACRQFREFSAGVGRRLKDGEEGGGRDGEIEGGGSGWPGRGVLWRIGEDRGGVATMRNRKLERATGKSGFRPWKREEETRDGGEFRRGWAGEDDRKRGRGAGTRGAGDGRGGGTETGGEEQRKGRSVEGMAVAARGRWPHDGIPVAGVRSGGGRDGGGGDDGWTPSPAFPVSSHSRWRRLLFFSNDG